MSLIQTISNSEEEQEPSTNERAEKNERHNAEEWNKSIKLTNPKRALTSLRLLIFEKAWTLMIKVTFI